MLRLLLHHPEVELHQATSERNAGQFFHQLHPNLRGVSSGKFCSLNDIQHCDFLFLCLPHGQAAARMPEFMNISDRIVDCSADFRLHDPDVYESWYGQPHPHPALLEQFVYGLPEVYRDQIREAKLVSGVGCNATATNLALLPLAREES